MPRRPQRLSVCPPPSTCCRVPRPDTRVVASPTSTTPYNSSWLAALAGATDQKTLEEPAAMAATTRRRRMPGTPESRVKTGFSLARRVVPGG
ncbi:Uncharacterised protein [Bordetella pertussis]|nr:Uncharacterised protein [Bordetella pertussis]